MPGREEPRPGRRARPARSQGPSSPDRAPPRARTPPAPAQRQRGTSSTVNQRYDHAPDDEEDDDRDHRTDVDCHAASAERRDHPSEEVQIRVDHLMDEVDGRPQPRVVGHPRDPGEQHPDEDQDEVDEEERADVVRDVNPREREEGGHLRTFARDASTAASSASRILCSSSAFRPASVIPPGDATARFSAAGSWSSSSPPVALIDRETIRRAWSSVSPSRTPASTSTSAISARYPGEQPIMAVAASISPSSISITSPISPRSAPIRP